MRVFKGICYTFVLCILIFCGIVIAKTNGAILGYAVNANKIYIQSEFDKAKQESYDKGFADNDKENQQIINGYKDYVAGIENGDKVIATFYYKDKVFDTQIVEKNSKIDAKIPTTNENEVFNGWKLDNDLVDFESQTFSNNVMFEADIVNKYEVKFMVDGSEFATQKILENNTVEVPDNPTKEDYVFIGWSIDEISVIDLSTFKIDSNQEIYALFVPNYSLVATSFNADASFLGSYIWTDGQNTYYSHYDYFNKFYSHYVLNQETNTWIQKKWNGFNNFYGGNIWSDGKKYYCSTDSKVSYVLNQETSTWEKIKFNGFNDICGSYVWTLGDKVYYSNSSNQYIFNKETLTWETMTWYGLTSFSGYGVWEYKGNVYLGDEYILNKDTNTWETMTWNGFNSFGSSSIFNNGETLYCIVSNSRYVLDYDTKTWYNTTPYFYDFDASCIWEINNEFYYSKNKAQYKYNKVKDSWETCSWNFFADFDSEKIWYNDGNIYYALDYVYNKETNSWDYKSWSGLTTSQILFSGSNVWTDGENIYYSYSNNQYKLKKGTNIWEPITWNGLTNFTSYSIWSSDGNVYYSSGSSQYILNKDTITWETMTWNGLTSFGGSSIWELDGNIYYSNSNNQYILNKETNTWEKVTWNGLSSFAGYNIWTDGEDIYYSNTHKLNKETNTWEQITWNNFDYDFSTNKIWSDGENLYYLNNKIITKEAN